MQKISNIEKSLIDVKIHDKYAKSFLNNFHSNEVISYFVGKRFENRQF